MNERLGLDSPAYEPVCLRSSEPSGFTLVEMTISMAILVVVSLLTFVVTQATTSAIAVSQAKEMAQASVRNALADMTTELALASKKTNTAFVPQLDALTVVSGAEIVFQVPASSSGTVWSAPITYRFINEDVGPNGGNARLDDGEDTDGDLALSRHIERIQGETRRVVGAANDISNVQFSLNPPTNDVLRITVTATKAINNRRHDLVSSTATSSVYLTN
jgi:prepilin-type N-terminal cleavage/methylation domain-containing protein